MLPRRPKTAPTPPKMAQDDPKTAPRHPKTDSRQPKMTQGLPKTAPRYPMEAPRDSPDHFKIALGSPKTAPIPLQDRPKKRNEASLENARQMPVLSHTRCLARALKKKKPSGAPKKYSPSSVRPPPDPPLAPLRCQTLPFDKTSMSASEPNSQR